MITSEYLIDKYGFKRCGGRLTTYETAGVVDIEKFSCVLRIGDIHYLYFSDIYKYFSLGIRHENPKGLAGGGKKDWSYMMIPRIINNIEDADKLVNGVVDFSVLYLYP